MARILIVRLSAFGDVAMLVPVVASVASKYPRDTFTVLTRNGFTPLFRNLGFNVNVIGFDARDAHKGIGGLHKINKRLVSRRFTHMADMHDVLRTKFMRLALGTTGTKVRKIDKGRKEKAEMIASKNTEIPLKSTIQRYLDVFDRLGFPARLNFESILDFIDRDVANLNIEEKEGKWVAIAPFAKHKGKIYPLERMEKVVESLSKDPSIKIFLFGAGAEENKVLNAWAEKYESATNVSGKYKIEKELILMSHMDVMVSMDSANMHLASLVKTPVVSIWGATHPSLGFYGYKQDLDNAVQIDFECRPCSVFGDMDCARGDYACMNGISEKMITDKIYKVLKEREGE